MVWPRGSGRAEHRADPANFARARGRRSSHACPPLKNGGRAEFWCKAQPARARITSGDRVLRVSRIHLAAVVGLLVSSCSQAPPETPSAVLRASPPPFHSTGPHEPLRGYRLAESFVAKGPFRDGAALRVGAIVDGLRVRPDASGLRFSESVAVPALKGGVPLPDTFGGGLLFWNATALYTADSFLGTLEPLLDIGFLPVNVSFGPNFALVRGDDGERLAIDFRTRQRVTLAPPLLADVAVANGGRALALLEGGTCMLSEDAGKNYRALSLPPGARALSVREVSGQLIASLTSDSQMRIDPAGNVQIEAASRAPPGKAIGDSLWPLPEPPLEHALGFGVPIGEEFAGVAVAGSVATVNLRTGELVQVTRALVPSELSCRTLDANGALLLACNSKTNGSLVLSDAFGERPLTQAKFASGVRLDFAAGVLLASARCDGLVQPGAVCVRSMDGRFHDFDVSVQLTKLESSSPQPTQAKPGSKPAIIRPTILRWVPKVGGGAVAVIAAQVPGLLDAQTGTFVPLSQDALDKAALETAHGGEDWLGLDWIALADGSLRGWLSNRAVSITSDGRLEPSVYEFRSLSGAGAHALAFDGRQRVFQSADWGRSWVETLAPPSFASDSQLKLAPHCSLVGCSLGPWLRVGWQAEVPAARVRTQNVAPAPPRVPREPLPALSCEQLRAASVGETTETDDEPDEHPLLGLSRASFAGGRDYEATFSAGTVHPVNGSAEALGLRAALAIRAPLESDSAPLLANSPGYSNALARITFVSPFEPSAQIQATTLSWRALNEAARAGGGEWPAIRPGQIDGSAVPVLGINPGEAAGLILSSEVSLWVRSAGGATALSSINSTDDASWISAVRRPENKLVMLGGHGDGTLDVVEFTAGRARRLFQMPGLGAAHYPANPDALAVGSQGALAILRTPSGSEPASVGDPAALFHEDGSVTVLAPWSRLFLANAPECKPQATDYRAVLQTSVAWLRVIDASQPVTDDALQAGMFAMLRANGDRLCLEAIELAGAPVERAGSSHETRLSARFVGRGPGAVRLGIESGFEFRQALSCRLSSTH